MKQLTCLFVLFTSWTSIIAQNSLAGYVKLQSSGKTPLSNVEVYAIGAQTTYTNDKGYFELKFDNKRVGDLVAAVEFSLEGYVLINEEKCEGLAIPTDPSLAPLQIVMSKKNVFREQKAKYYGIIINNAEEVYQQQNRQLLEQLANLEAKLEKLQGVSRQQEVFEEERRILLTQIDNLQKENEQVIANAERYAQIFAKIDTDGVSELTSKALELFEGGKIKEAIALMDDEQLRQNLKNAKAAKKEAKSLTDQADSMLQQCVENYMIKARLCAADLQLEAAYKNYLYAVEGDSTNVENLWELALFCGWLNQQKRSINFYQQALRYSQVESEKAHLLHNLGSELTNNNQYDKAEAANQKALEIRKRLAQANPEHYEPDVAMTQNNLGNMYADLNAYDKAEEAYNEALEIYQRLAQANPEHYEPKMAMIQNNLGLIYADLNAYDKAEEACKEALKIYQRLAQANPERYELFVAATQNNLGLMYTDLNAYDKAKEAYKEALEIYQRLTQANPKRYEPFVATTQNNLGNMYADLNAYDKAEEAYKEALEIRKRLAQANPERYEPDVAMIQNNLGLIYADLNAYDKAEEAYKEALEIRKRLAQANPERYEPDVATTQNNLGLIYADLNAYDKAEEAYKEALEIRKRLAQANPERYEPFVAMIQNNLGNMYADLNAYDKAKEACNEALEIYQRLVQANPDRYEPFVAATQNNLGNMYADLNAYDKAETAYKEALEIYQRLVQANPERYEPYVATTQNNLGNMYADLNAYDKAEAAYKEALEIRKRLAQANPERYEPDVAMTQNNLGIMYSSIGKTEKAMPFLDQSLSIYQKLAVKSPQAFDLVVARILIIKALIFVNQGKQSMGNEALIEAKALAEKYPDAPFSATVLQSFEQLYKEVNLPYQQALEKFQPWQEEMAALTSEALKAPIQQQIVMVFSEAAADHPDNQAIISELSSAYGALAWYQLFSKDFAAAEQAARKGLEVDPSQQWINTNLALGLLFQGKYEEAETIYIQLKDQPFNENMDFQTVFLNDLSELEAAGITHPDVEKVRTLLQE
jgi:tetratricopeptide (TPR) repeat protein